MKKILLSLLVVGVVGFTAVKATGAFFTANVDSGNNKFTAGTLTIDVLDQNLNSQFLNKTLKENWVPGEEVQVNFDVKNTGTVPLQLRGYAVGSWGDPTLDGLNMVKVTKVERWTGSWSELASNSSGLTGYFYYALNGLPAGPFYDVAPGDRAQFQLTIKLDNNAGNEFQGKTFTTSIHAEARQATTPTTVWP